MSAGDRGGTAGNVPMVIRRAEVRDLDGLCDVENACFSPPWSRASMESTLTGDGRCVLLAEEAGRTVGYASYWRVLEEADVLSVAVLPEFRRQGIGMALMGALLTQAKSESVEIVHLEVRRSNVTAQSLYERCGFAADGLRPRYYSRPTEDAVLMSCRL